MSKVIFYTISDGYIEHLRKEPRLTKCILDSHQYSRKNKRPYFGVLLKFNKFNYFVPLSSPKINNDYFINNDGNISYRKSSFTIKRFFDEHNSGIKVVGKALLNNMIPVSKNDVSYLDYSLLSKKAIDLLNKENDIIQN